MHRFIVSTLLPLVLASPVRAEQAKPSQDVWAKAAKNGDRAHEVFNRCHRLVQAWYRHTGAGNQLLPQNLGSRQWTAQNSAADLWSFFVLTTYLTDEAAFNGQIRQTLRDEIRLTTRLDSLPDDYHIDRNAFVREEINLPRIIFGSSEYVKDGLLPIAELMGRTVWFERSRSMLDDIFKHAPTKTKFGMLPGDTAEVNGEMLQNLCRYYSATGDPRYKAWAERIGDAYFLEILPNNNDLPCHAWDFEAGKPRDDRLSLSDHGNEIIFGLSEVVMLEHVYDKAKAAQYMPAMRRMLDKLLKIARNEDGLWVHTIQPSTGKVLKSSTPDTWGYALDAYYAFYLATGEEKYREAVHRALKGINAKPKYREWGGSDAFADSIESGIVLLNRIPEPEGFAWLEATVPAFLAKQREDGIIEGWHGDGNYARTALMYALMKTAGTRVSGWRKDLRFGAAMDGEGLCVVLRADKPWKGKLHFDYPRHRMHMGLQINYPRLNEFPEWYTVEPTRLYDVTVGETKLPTLLGDDLMRGIDVEIKDGPVQVVVLPLTGPPYGGRVIRVQAPTALGGTGKVSATVIVKNMTGTPQAVKLSTDFGTIAPTQARLPVDGELRARLSGELTKSGEAKVRVQSIDGDHDVVRGIRLICEKGLVGFAAYHDQEYKGKGYLWSLRRPVEAELSARPGKAHTLHLLWGSKNDKRAGVVTINGKALKVAQEGYDGFKWVKLPVPAELVKDDTVHVRVVPYEKDGKAAFISEMKLTCP